MDNKKMLIGFNTFSPDVNADKFSFSSTQKAGKGVDFVVCHFDPDRFNYNDSLKEAETTAEKLKNLGIDLIANFEFQNFSLESKSPDGFDWANQKDGTHRLELPDEYIKALASAGNLKGIMYDEFEHVIINRNLSIALASKFRKNLSVFKLLSENNPVKQGKLLTEQLKDYAARIKNAGSPALCGEHVFPVLFHTFCKSGLTPNFKSQKESSSNIQFAIAGGAALQYGTPLWNCVDLWFRLTNPGHSSEEMYNNLVFAYLAGVNRVYVESCHAFTTNEQVNEYGKKFGEFSENYRNKDRDYDISDYTPEIGIIRFDDTYWGQCDPVMWKRMLFGNKKIKITKEAREYTKAFHIITHGETCKNGLSWGRISPWSLRKHRSFVSMNSAVVFDDNVEYDKLKSLKLCFLCGYTISDTTLKAVEKAVNENGLTVITSKRFTPDSIKNKIKGSYCEINQGSGKWIVTEKLLSSKVKNAAKPFIGNKGEIRLTFGEKEIRLKISENGETFTII